jgi:hypothetical protein
MITVTIWRSVAHDAQGRQTAMLDGYQPGDPMVAVFTYQADPAGRPTEQIVAEVFDTFNDRPLTEVRTHEHGTHPLRLPATPRAAGQHLKPGGRGTTVNEKETVTVARVPVTVAVRQPRAGCLGRPFRPASRRRGAAHPFPVRHGCRSREHRRRGEPWHRA